jgi:LCP family protein required for cell wall assembly
MDCTDARRLLDAGVQPGRGGASQAALGFHLAECAACRAYRDRPDQALLAALLAAPPPRTARPAAVPAAPEGGLDEAGWGGEAPPAPAARRWLRPAITALGVLALLLVVLLVGRVALALISIQRNVQAMQLPTIAPGPALNNPARAAAPPPTPRPAAPRPTGAAPQAAATSAPAAPGVPPRATLTATPQAVGAAATPGLAPPPTLAPGSGAANAPAPGGAITVLLMGVDARPGETEGVRTDALIVVRIDPQMQRIALLSLPRDLIVDIPGYGQARINAASVYGDLYPELGGGVNLERKTVSNLLGIPIDYVVRVDFNGFISAIDAIGGIDINVPEEIYDPEYPTMDYGYMEAHFLPGPQHMDGQTALIYSRMRHMDSNYARNRRQQLVLLGILDRFRRMNAIERLQGLADLTGAMRSYVQTDLPQDRMIALAWAFRNFKSEHVERYALDETMVYEGAGPDDPYATFANPGAIESLVAKLLRGPNG